MIEIKFRALKDDMSNCRFYYGSLIYDKEGNPRIHDVYTNTFHTCIKGTEGQYTGLKDKNGKEIYEGDIIKVDIFSKPYFISFGQSEKWGACFCVQSHNSITFLTKNWSGTSEVIGNIHENSELLTSS